MNKTESSIKEIHYWMYLYHYAAKKEYVNLIIKNDNMSVKSKLLQLNERCIKGIFDDLIGNFKQRKKHYKNKTFFQKKNGMLFFQLIFYCHLVFSFYPKLFYSLLLERMQT